jgi:CubicO group peptidase (beta-lactamase class C family)
VYKRQVFAGCIPSTIDTPTVTPSPEVTPTVKPTPAPTLNIQTIAPTSKFMPIGDAEGFSKEKLDEIDLFIQNEVANGFPGAVLLVAKDGKIVHHASFGFARKYDGKLLMQNPIPMQDDTLFDIASLTKVYGTTFAIMKLIDEGKLALDDKVSKYLDGYLEAEDGKADITVRMLLRHSSGYGSDIRFFDKSMSYSDTLYSMDRDKTISLLSQIPLDNEPNTQYKYNDIDYLVLCAIIEKASGQRLDEYLKQNIFTPLGIQDNIMYKPLDNGLSPHAIAATERMGNTRDGVANFDGIRDYTLQGEVHDEKAYYSMGSVSGHAGLFADANALAVLSQVLINGGEFNGVRILSSEVVDTFTKTYDDEKYQLGFWRADTSDTYKKFTSPNTLYHYGWTGTATMIDMDKGMTIILLTNKRHSPCDWDKFEGNDNYSTGKYTKIIEMVYNSLK